MSTTTKTAYVTGGASGIGQAVAEALSKRGIRVAVADINLKGAQEVASKLQHNAIAVECDAGDWDSQLAAFKHTQAEFGRIDYVYGIAGITEHRWIPKDEGNKDEFVKPNLRTLDVNLNGVLYTISLAVQLMRRQEPDERGVRGKIAVTASVCGLYSVPGISVYTAAKHGVVGFVRSYGKMLAKQDEGITLNAVCPHVVKTNISTAAFHEKMKDKDLLTPMEYVVEAFEKCLDSDITGQTLEVGPTNRVTPRYEPEPIDQAAADTLEMLYVRVPFARGFDPGYAK